MRHSYEDILTAVGEFGTWQFRRLLSLWTIMLMLGAHYALFQILSFSQDEFICDPPVTANCKLNISRKGEVIANGSKWRFANSRSISIDDKVNKYKYHHVFPRIHRLHHEHENNAGYRTSGVISNDLFLTKIQEVFMTNSFCKVHNPFRDENGNCFWNGSSVNQGSYICKTYIHFYNMHMDKNGTRKETGDWYHFNPNFMTRPVRLSLEDASSTVFLRSEWSSVASPSTSLLPSSGGDLPSHFPCLLRLLGFWLCQASLLYVY